MSCSSKAEVPPENTHAARTLCRHELLIVFNGACARCFSRPCVLFIRARLASHPRGFYDMHSCLARGEFSCRNVFDLGGARLTARSVRPRITDRPHDSAPPAHDLCSCVDVAGCTYVGSLAWIAAV